MFASDHGLTQTARASGTATPAIYPGGARRDTARSDRRARPR